MKRFAFGRVLDGIRSSSSSSTQQREASEPVEEKLKQEHFEVADLVKYGFPFRPTAMAYDPVQRLLAIGTRNGSVRIFGRPGVDCDVRHESEASVIQMLFLVNEGALVSVCADDSIHLWNLRQKTPALLHSLKFSREHITHCYLPFRSKWLYVGTERGNVQIVSVASFQISGYAINWNRCIDVATKTHPGAIVHLSDSPVDPNRLLVGYEIGLIVLWDLRAKQPEARYVCHDALRSVAWHHDGRQFLCSHYDGSLSTWDVRSPGKAAAVAYPHTASCDSRQERCKPILKAEWRMARGGESYVVFSGGLPFERPGRVPCLTVMRGGATTVLEMEHGIVDFACLCETPHACDYQDPYAIAVLLHNDLVVLDLTADGYPCFENPYSHDVHESPVTSVLYVADCPTDLVPALYKIGQRQKNAGFSRSAWPITGGVEASASSCSYPEVMITGHADGSVKFWDASSATLQVLYKLKTPLLFEGFRGGPDEEDPYAIEKLCLCPESRMLCLAGTSGQVILFNFGAQEATRQVPSVDVSILYDAAELASPECESPPDGISLQVDGGRARAATAGEQQPLLEVKQQAVRLAPGYQAEFVCLLTTGDAGEPPPPVTSLAVNSCYRLLAFGNECGLAVVDCAQRAVLLCVGTPELYGAADPHHRGVRSPRIRRQPSAEERTDEPRSRATAESLQTANSKDSTDSHQSDQSSGERAGADADAPAPVPPPRRKRQKEAVARQAAAAADKISVDSLPDAISEGVAVEQPAAAGIDDGRPHERPSRMDMTKKAKSFKESIRKAFQKAGSQEVGEPAAAAAGNDDSDSSASLTSTTPQEDEEAKRLRRELEAMAENGGGQHGGASPRAQKTPREEGAPELLAAPPGGEPRPDDDKSSESSLAAKMSRSFALSMRSRSVTKMLGERKETRSPVQEAADPAGALPPAWGNYVDRVLLDLRADSEDLLTPTYGSGGKGAPRGGGGRSATDRPDGGGAPSWSRSSSMSEIESVVGEAVTSLAFTESLTSRTDAFTSPCLWIGTSLGSLLIAVLNLPPASARATQPVIVVPNVNVFRLKGALKCISLLDSMGTLVPPKGEPWDAIASETAAGAAPAARSQRREGRPPLAYMQSVDAPDRQYVLACTEKQARVLALPSHACAFKARVTERSFVVCAEVVHLCSPNSSALVCYVADGRVKAFSLPSLRRLLDVVYLPPLCNLRVARTFQISNNGHALFMSSPTEIQKLAYSSELCRAAGDAIGELFHAVETPEAPKQGFFKGLFGGAAASLDRQELFGEDASGKASRSIAQYTPGRLAINDAQLKSQGLAGEVSKVRMALTERGDKLGDLEDRTARMLAGSENYSQAAHNIMLKYKNKKWYEW